MPVIAINKTVPVSAKDEPLINLTIDGYSRSYSQLQAVHLVEHLTSEINRAADSNHQIRIEGTDFWISPDGARRLITGLHNQLRAR